MRADWLWLLILISVFALVVVGCLLDMAMRRKAIKKLRDDFQRYSRKK